MDMGNAIEFRPPDSWQRFLVIDSHTGGEPFRVVVDGMPDIPGSTVLERRSYAMKHFDHLRQVLMWEPRGHADMYGCILGPPERADSDLSVLFIHNEGFSTMCGHGIIALSKVLIDTGVVRASSPEHTLAIDTPAGQIVSVSNVSGEVVTSTRFTNVASFATALSQVIVTPNLGEVQYDLGYGGAFYAYVDAPSHDLSLDDVGGLMTAGREIKAALSTSPLLSHPEAEDLGFLYGVIFHGPAVGTGAHSRNVCIFADGEVDRSPTGTGVSGRLAILDAQGAIDPGEAIVIESIVGSRFEGRIVGRTKVGRHNAIIPEITGSAHITGRSEFWVDPRDRLGAGFLLD